MKTGKTENMDPKTDLTEKALAATMRCRHCGQKIDVDPNPFRPFCSDRCRKVDLGKWFGESYRVADNVTPATYPKKAENEEDENG